MSNKGKKTIDELRKGDNTPLNKKDAAGLKGGARGGWLKRRLLGDVTPQ